MGERELFSACEEGNIYEVMKMIDASHQAIHWQDKETWTPLHFSCWKGHVEVVELLLAANADITTKDKHGRTPLHEACWKGHVKVVKLLLLANADITTKDHSGSTPLHEACRDGYDNILQLLLENNSNINDQANINSKNELGKTPLHVGCSRGHDGVVQVLLSAKADPNTQSKTGKTPLHEACEKAYVYVASLLLSHNAEMDINDKEGKIPGEEFSSWLSTPEKEKIQNLLREEIEKRKKMTPPSFVQPCQVQELPFLEINKKKQEAPKPEQEKIKNGEQEKQLPSKKFAEIYANEAIKNDDFEMAASVLTRAVTQFPEDCDAFFALGLVKIAQGDHIIGADYVKQGLQLEPEWCFRDTDHEGTMEKKGEGIFSFVFRQRVFRLKNRFLFHYEDSQTKTPNGFMILISGTKITLHPSRPLEFQICSPTKRYELRVDSEKNKLNWIKTLEDHLDRAFTLPSFPA